MDKLVLSVFFCTRILTSVGSDLQIRFFISLRFIQNDISACHSEVMSCLRQTRCGEPEADPPLA